MPRRARALLVVDGYNVIYATPRYLSLVDEQTAPSRLGNDPFDRARELLLSDVASYAHKSHEAVIVYDGAGNPSPEHPAQRRAGVTVMFSAAGQSADELIEQLVTSARRSGRPVSLVTSDGTVRATAGFGPGEVTCVSSALLAHEVEQAALESERVRRQATRAHLTLEDRISPEQRAKLWSLLGR